MTKEEKLKMLEGWLQSKGIDFTTKAEEDADKLYIKKPHKIVVLCCEPEFERQNFEVASNLGLKAFFIRDEETIDFICEKMTNCLKGWSRRQAEREKKMAKKAEEARKRIEQPSKRARKREHIRKHVYAKVEKV